MILLALSVFLRHWQRTICPSMHRTYVAEAEQVCQNLPHVSTGCGNQNDLILTIQIFLFYCGKRVVALSKAQDNHAEFPCGPRNVPAAGRCESRRQRLHG